MCGAMCVCVGLGVGGALGVHMCMCELCAFCICVSVGIFYIVPTCVYCVYCSYLRVCTQGQSSVLDCHRSLKMVTNSSLVVS